MTAIPSFTSVNFDRPTSYAEDASPPFVISTEGEVRSEGSDQKIKKKKDPLSLKKFESRVNNFSIYSESRKKKATDLIERIPETLKSEEVIKIIFEKAGTRHIPFLLDAFLVRHPSFALSPFDKIHRAIIEDHEEHLLTNSSLAAMLKEHELDRDEIHIEACCDLAYRINHPNIYRLSKTSVLPVDYTINFLWINLNPQDRVRDAAQNIFKDGLDSFENDACIKDPNALRTLEKTEQSLETDALENWQGIKKTFAYRISKWADANPDAHINLWYDSALVTQKAQQKTFEMMRDISQSRGVDLQLRDIRQLPNLQGEIQHSLHPGTPVYYRVDILKALIADHMISSHEESAKYCVVSDIDVDPMTSQEMFDQRTLGYLSVNGYVFNRVGLFGFENSFFIFNKEKEELQTIHYQTILKRTASLISELRGYPKGTCFRPEGILGSQSVFNNYSKFRNGMREEEWGDVFLLPRKVVKCSRSQFNFGGCFIKSDHQEETFRFMGADNVPYTRNGRNFRYGHLEEQIDELKDWKAEPLDLPL